MRLRWTNEALKRLQEIEEFIAMDNPSAPAKFVNKLISLAERIPENPKKGRIVPELSIEYIRELLHQNYRIVYLIMGKSIEVLTVFEGHQLLKKEDVSRNINPVK